MARKGTKITHKKPQKKHIEIIIGVGNDFVLILDRFWVPFGLIFLIFVKLLFEDLLYFVHVFYNFFFSFNDSKHLEGLKLNQGQHVFLDILKLLYIVQFYFPLLKFYLVLHVFYVSAQHL